MDEDAEKAGAREKKLLSELLSPKEKAQQGLDEIIIKAVERTALSKQLKYKYRHRIPIEDSEDPVNVSPPEQRFLNEIRDEPDNLQLRMVYADWLDEQGQPERASWLRTEADLIGEAPKRGFLNWKVQMELAYMRIGIPDSWLIQVSRMPVDNCQRERTLRFDFVCDRRWESLETTSNPEVRHCNSCDMNVHHCKTIEAARQCAHQGQCVALDPSIRRKAGDLSPSQLHTVEVMTLGFVSPD